MIKMILAFVFLFVIFYAGIELFNRMTGEERWEVAKTFSYSIALALGAIAVLVCMVVLF